MNSGPNSSKLAIIAIGHSVRALLAAIRPFHNLRCLAVDYYGDADTRDLATDGWIPLALDENSRLTSQTLAIIESFAIQCQSEGCEVVVLLAGGMENHLDSLDQLSFVGRLLSPGSQRMLQLRDRNVWRDAALASGLMFPEILEKDCDDIDHLSDQWLWKPTSGAGGWKVKRASRLEPTAAANGYWQREIDGRSIGVTCVLNDTSTRLIGATESLSDRHWPAPSEFIYRGSAGPIALPERSHFQIVSLCEYLRHRYQVRGWLQFDFILDVHDSLWLLECNPRWTAGMEVLVDAGINPVAEHLSAWGYSVATNVAKPIRKLTAKAIVYATEDLSVHQGFFVGTEWDTVVMADVPFGSQQVENGSPIATLKASLDQDPSASFDHQLRILCARLNEARMELIGRLTKAS